MVRRVDVHDERADGEGRRRRLGCVASRSFLGRGVVDVRSCRWAERRRRGGSETTRVRSRNSVFFVRAKLLLLYCCSRASRPARRASDCGYERRKLSEGCSAVESRLLYRHHAKPGSKKQAASQVLPSLKRTTRRVTHASVASSVEESSAVQRERASAALAVQRGSAAQSRERRRSPATSAASIRRGPERAASMPDQ